MSSTVKPRRFTPEEDKYILENLKVKTKTQIARDLGRSLSSIGSRIQSLTRPGSRYKPSFEAMKPKGNGTRKAVRLGQMVRVDRRLYGERASLNPVEAEVVGLYPKFAVVKLPAGYREAWPYNHLIVEDVAASA